MPDVVFVAPPGGATGATLTVKDIMTGAVIADVVATFCTDSTLATVVVFDTTNGSGVISLTAAELPRGTYFVEVNAPAFAGLIDHPFAAAHFTLDFDTVRDHEVRIVNSTSTGTGTRHLHVSVKKVIQDSESADTVPNALVVLRNHGEATVFGSGISSAVGRASFSHTSSITVDVCVACAGYHPGYMDGVSFTVFPGTETVEVFLTPITPSAGTEILEMTLTSADALGAGVAPAMWGGVNFVIKLNDEIKASGGFNMAGKASASLEAGPTYHIYISSPTWRTQEASPIEALLPGGILTEISIPMVAQTVTPLLPATALYRAKVATTVTNTTDSVPKYIPVACDIWLTTDTDGQDVIAASAQGPGSTTPVPLSDLLASTSLPTPIAFVFPAITPPSPGYYLWVRPYGGYEPINGLNVDSDDFGITIHGVLVSASNDGPGNTNDGNPTETATVWKHISTTLLLAGGIYTITPGVTLLWFYRGDSAAASDLIAGPLMLDSATGVLDVLVTDPCWVVGLNPSGGFGPLQMI